MKRLIAPALLLAALLPGCAFHSTATRWNGTVGPDGEPVYVKATTNVGLNLVVLLKLLGGVNTEGMIDELTDAIAEEGGDRVRIIQSSSTNYWFGFPPFTWVLTPVITTVSAEYRPDAELHAENLAEQKAEDEE
jgi:hypothetical protein